MALLKQSNSFGKDFFIQKSQLYSIIQKFYLEKLLLADAKKNRKQIKFFIRNLFRAVCALCISASHVRCHPISDFIISFSFLAILPPSFVLYLLFLSCLCTLITLCFPFFSLSVFFLRFCPLRVSLWLRLRATAVGGGYGGNFVRRASCAHVPYTLEGRAKKSIHQMKSEIR